MFSRKMEGQGLISGSDGKRLISNSKASIEGTPHALEGAPIQYHATTVPQPFFVHGLATTSSTVDGTATENDTVPCEQPEQRENDTAHTAPTMLVESKKKDNELEHSMALTSLVTINSEQFNTNKLFLIK